MESTRYVGISLLVISIGLRLTGGATPLDGTPEVLVNNGYQPICDEHITPEVAMVICRELGFSPLNVTMKDDTYSDNRASFLKCSGDETSLMSDCGWVIFPDDKPCQSQEGITCNGNIRLMYGLNITQGNVQVYRAGKWAGICDHNARANTAQVVCRQMGYDSDHPTLYMGSYFGPGLPGDHYMECSGDEASHEDCQNRPMPDPGHCDEDHNLAVDCIGEFLQATLWPIMQHPRDPKPVEEGYREVSLLTADDFYGTWCDDVDGASEEELRRMKRIAAVLCVGERFSRYNPQLTNANYDGYYDERVLSISTMECTGRENRLAQCVRRATWLSGASTCNRSHHVAVKCNGFIRLMDGTSESNGRVEFMEAASGKWRPWLVPYPDHADALVLCQQLGFESWSSSMTMALRHGDSFGRAETEEAWPYEYTCNGMEGRIQDCQQGAYTGRGEGERFGHMGVDCDAPSIDVAPSDTVTLDEQQTALGGLEQIPSEHLLLLRSGEETEWSLACGGINEELDTKVTGVVCHSLGFSRFGSRSWTIPLSSSDSMAGKSDLLVRAVCKGTEEDLSWCSLDVSDSGEPRTCDSAIILECQERATCPTSTYQEDKQEITCYDYCESLACNPRVNLQTCSLKDGGGCLVEKTYSRTGFNFERTGAFGTCVPNCESEHSEGFDNLRSRECCYEDKCSQKDTAVPRFKQRVKLQGGWEPSLGAVLISLVPDQWRHVTLDDRRVPETFLRMVCREAGYTGGNVVQVKNFQTVDGPSIRLLNYSECDVIGATSCPNQQAAGVGDVLAVNCNARSPQLRLVGGLSGNMGRLEVLYRRQWGTVCQQGFTLGTADIACKTLGYPGGCVMSSAVDPVMARFRSGRQRIGFSRLSCRGYETNLLYCDYELFKENASSCTHEHDVGIVCDTWPTTSAGTIPPPSSTISSGGVEIFEPATSPPTAAPGKETTQLTCAVGTCQSVNCKRVRLVTCDSPNTAFCFMEETKYINGATSFTFGCRQNECSPGLVKVNNNDVKTTCCTSSMCNSRLTGINATDNANGVPSGWANLTDVIDVTNTTVDQFFIDGAVIGSANRLNAAFVITLICVFALQHTL